MQRAGVAVHGRSAMECERGREERGSAVQSGEPGEYSGEEAQGEARVSQSKCLEGTYHRVPYASCCRVREVPVA